MKLDPITPFAHYLSNNVIMSILSRFSPPQIARLGDNDVCTSTFNASKNKNPSRKQRLFD